MLRITLHVPAALADDAAAVLELDDHALNLVRQSGVCRRPDGDVVSAMLPRERAPIVLDALAACGVTAETASITIEEQLTVLSRAADDAARRAVGAPGDALLWPVVRATTGLAAEPSFAYYAFMVLATAIAAIGLLTSSSVLIVGAMILGPEFGALAHICVSALARDGRGIVHAHLLLLSGFAVAIALTALLVTLIDHSGLVGALHVQRAFERTIVSPSWLGLLVAGIAGAAGVLTLTSAKGQALIGVLVSVTTIPAAAEAAIGVSFRDGSRIADALATLVLNLGGMVVAGGLMLLMQRAATLPTRR